MMEDDAFIEEVEASLLQATDGQLARVMRFIDRLPARGRLEDLVAPVRGRLAMVRPARSLTLARVLTLPIEDLLVDTRYDKVSPWVLPRDILPVFHELCLGGLDHAARRAAEEEVPGATMDDREAVVAAGGRLWPAAARTLRLFLEGGDPASVAGLRPEHVGRLAGMAELLEHAEDLTGFLEQLPARPMPRLGSEARAVAMASLFRAAKISPSALRLVFTMLTRRSDDPAEFHMLLLNRDFGLGVDVRDAILSEAMAESLTEIELINADLTGWEVEGRVYPLAETALRLVSLLRSLEGLPAPLRPDQDRISALRRAAAETLMGLLEDVWRGPVRDAFAVLAAPCAPAASSDEASSEGPSSDGSRYWDLVADERAGLMEGLARAARKIDIACAGLGGGEALEARRSRELDYYRLTIGYHAEPGEGEAGPANGRADAIIDALRFVEILFGTDAAAGIAAEIGIR